MLRSALLLAAALGSLTVPAIARDARTTPEPTISAPQVRYRTQAVNGLQIFYREAGPVDAPTLVLLHGFPTSSHMYRDLIPLLATRYRVIAPDYPGYGSSSSPAPSAFAYTFDHLADVMGAFIDSLGVRRYVLYVQDFGGPVGFRLAFKRPEQIAGLVIQNANAYEEGLSEALNSARPFWFKRTLETEAPMREFLKPEMTKHQYTSGAQDLERISPDAWNHAQSILDRPGNDEIQLSLLHDYGSNVARYPEWQTYFRQHQPPTLIVWGKNDPFFTVEGANAYLRDLPDAQVHLLDAGHFALEEKAHDIAGLMIAFLDRRPPTTQGR
jgi:pimeloyl-ACP methyl ester carboxylesterase